MESYYYERLDKRSQAVYYALYAGLRDLRPSIDVPEIDIKALGDLYFLIRMDHPEIFYTVTFRYRKPAQGTTIIVEPVYLFDPKKIRTHMTALASRADKLARPYMDKREDEKLQYVHDFICGNVRYDKLKKEYSHEIIGPLSQGVGVCEGIAKSFKLLCDRLNIWCIVALSDNNPEKGIRYRHTWNIVRLNGQFYHVDATFDNSLGSPDAIRYDYFCLSDRAHFRDHEPVIHPVPACADNGRFYYREKKLSFTKTEEVSKRVRQAMKKNRTLVFHWRDGYLTRETLAELTSIIRVAAVDVGKSAEIHVNWPQAVFHIEPKQNAAESVMLEQANEGEEPDAADLPD